MIKIFEKYNLIYITYNLSDNIIIGFSTKHGGVSEGCRATMNLSYNREDEPGNVEENYRRLSEALEIDSEKIYLNHQVHYDKIRVIKERDLPGYNDNLEYDAFITNCPQKALAVIHADCVPVLFLSDTPENGEGNICIGAAHSGWKGTLAEIASKTALAMKSEYNIDLTAMKVLIGPCICRDCFTIKNDVYEQFKEKLPPALKYIRRINEEQYSMDMAGVIMESLTKIGIAGENIINSGSCTSCNEGLFYSHRRDKGQTGAMAGIICIK